DTPIHKGRIAYRAVFPSKLMGGFDIGSSRTKWWGTARHIVIYYTNKAKGEVYFVTSVPEPAEWLTRESWSAKGDVKELRAAYEGFHQDVRNVLNACPDCHKWAILEREPLRRWSDGRVLLLGDSAHPMTPYMAQGAATSIEDAAILARCLDAVNGEDIEGAFKRYEAHRKPRTSGVQAISSANTWMREGDGDTSWLYGYDAWNANLDQPASKPPMKTAWLRPAIEPGYTLVAFFRRARRQRHFAQLGGDAPRVIDLAIDARHDLRTSRPQIALLLVGFEGRRRIVRRDRDFFGENDCILGRHAGTLREILQHRVRGIGEQRDATLRPILHRLTVAEDPHAPGFDTLEHAQHLRHLHLEVLPHHILAALGVPSFLVMIGVENGDEVVELTAPQRVVHEMRARAGPEHDVGPPEIFRHILELKNAAIGDMSGNARLAVADQIFADFRQHAVAADQRAAFDGLTVVERDADSVAMIFIGVDTPARLKCDQVAALTCFEKGAVDVGPMGHRIRLAEPFEESITQRDIGDEFAGERVAHLLRWRTVRVGQECIFKPDFFEHAKDIGSQLDAGAHLAEFGRLLEKADGKSLMGKRVSGYQAADAAAGQAQRDGASRVGHGVTSINNAREADHKT